MGKLNGIAQDILNGTDFPLLPGPDDPNRSPNFEYPPEVDPEVLANLDILQIAANGRSLNSMHINWVISPRIHIARDALHFAIQQAKRDGVNIDIVTGRVTTPGVMALVEGTLSAINWRTYVELGGQALDLGCIVDSPQSEGLHDELSRHVDTGAPFVSFSPKLAIELA